MSARKPRVTVLGGVVGHRGRVDRARNTEVLRWLRDPDIAEAINTKHENPRYLPGMTLTRSLRATADLDQAVAAADVIVAAVPSRSTCAECWSRWASMCARGSRSSRWSKA